MITPAGTATSLIKYSVTATVTSGPTDVGLKINGKIFRMARDSDAVWSGKTDLELPDSVPIELRATGIADAAWTLEIKFNTPPPENKTVKDYKHEGAIPDDLLSIWTDTVPLGRKADE